MSQKEGTISWPITRKVGLLLGPLLSFLVLLTELDPSNSAATKMAAVAILMATWWITEAIPLAGTALLPLVLFPLLGILKGKAIAPVYVNSTIFLFVGGFMIALTMEKWHLQKRIALWIIKTVGGGPSRVVFGFMVASAFLSMWISNTATAIMMLPIALALVTQIEDEFGKQATHKFTLCLMLAIAYSCSIGGMATLVGTPPNLSFSRIFEITFPSAPPIEFGQWFLMGIPLSGSLLLLTWLILTKFIFPFPEQLKTDHSIVKREYHKLGKMSFEEKVVFSVFVMTAFLWVFRKNLNFGFIVIPGWSSLLTYSQFIDDGTVALFMALVLFLIPSRTPSAPSVMIMETDVFRRIPWDIVLLFGGGFALAKGFQVTGLSTLVGEKFAWLSGSPPIVIILGICFALTFLTEFTSNTATTEMVLPILASVAVAMEVNPLFLMVPATLSASCAFMMPVATPPNAIIFGSGRVKIVEMVRAGLLLNFVGILVITVIFYLVGPFLFSIDPAIFPDWAARP